MSKLRNKAVALMAAVAMAASMLVGCGSVKNDEIVATVGESKITAGVANFYARYESSSLEEYYKQYFSQMYSQYGYTDYEMRSSLFITIERLGFNPTLGLGTNIVGDVYLGGGLIMVLILFYLLGIFVTKSLYGVHVKKNII